MPLTATIKEHWMVNTKINVIGTLVASGNYAAGGEVPAFSSAESCKIKTGSAAVFEIVSGISKYMYRFNIANGKILVFDPATGLEIATAAYPAGVTGDTITFLAIYHKFN